MLWKYHWISNNQTGSNENDISEIISLGSNWTGPYSTDIPRTVILLDLIYVAELCSGFLSVDFRWVWWSFNVLKLRTKTRTLLPDFYLLHAGENERREKKTGRGWQEMVQYAMALSLISQAAKASSFFFFVSGFFPTRPKGRRHDYFPQHVQGDDSTQAIDTLSDYNTCGYSYVRSLAADWTRTLMPWAATNFEEKPEFDGNALRWMTEEQIQQD